MEGTSISLTIEITSAIFFGLAVTRSLLPVGSIVMLSVTFLRSSATSSAFAY